MNLFNLYLVVCLGSSGFLLTACSSHSGFEKACQLCQQIEQQKVQYTLNDFIHKNEQAQISAAGLEALNHAKEDLKQGHKFTACGCIGNQLIYQLWCANDACYQLEVELLDNNDYQLINIQKAQFPHP